MAARRDFDTDDQNDYWGRIRSTVEQTVSESNKRGTSETLAPQLNLVEQVALTLFDHYRMPVWSIDKEGYYLETLNVAARSMCTLFAETMCAERPPNFTEDEREALVSKALAMSGVTRGYPTLFMTQEANWLLFPVDHEEACCAIVLVR